MVYVYTQEICGGMTEDIRTEVIFIKGKLHATIVGNLLLNNASFLLLFTLCFF